MAATIGNFGMPLTLVGTIHAGGTMRRGRGTLLTLGLAWLMLYTTLSYAGPPFVTDDPDPVEPGMWEINFAVTATHASGQTIAAAPLVDANFGVAPGAQLHFQPQRTYSDAGPRHSAGIGDTEVGLKYRLTAQNDDPAAWMISAYPLYEIPTGDANRRLGTGSGSLFLPLWVQTTRGSWLHFGGAGYWINTGIGSRNAWAGGYGILYQLTDTLRLGGEVFAKGAAVVGDRTAVGANLGGDLSLNAHYALLFSAGRGLVRSAATNQTSAYCGLRVSY